MIQKVFAYLAAAGQPVYLVGGSLRQRLLNKPIKDYDFIVSQGAIRLAYRLADHFRLDCFPLDRERDMARVVLQDCTLDFAPYGKDLSLDLQARDLSLNAMACLVDIEFLSADEALLESRLIDPCHGLHDLRLGLIKGLSKSNFQADPLRLLRVYRFAASLNFKIEAETENWVVQCAPLLQQVAMERVLQELVPILLQSQSAQWLQRLKTVGLMAQILPVELLLSQLQHFETMSASDLLDKTEAYLEQSLSAQRPLLIAFKLALVLLNPRPKHKMSSLQDHLDPLTLSRKEIELILLWQRLTPQLLKLLEPGQDTAVTRFHLFRQAKGDILGLLLLAEVWRQMEGIDCPLDLLEHLLEQWLDPDNQIAHPRQLLDGHRLIQELELRPGPQIGQLLLAVQEAQACGKVVNSQEALAYARTLSSYDRK
jgi:tRNA nucleotidyltransferase (CCA-adding enzyme)